MQLKNLFLLLVWGLLLNACVPKAYTKQESVFIVFKTPTFKHADLGFIYSNKEEVKVEIYSSGQAALSLQISENSVCMSLFECMSKKSFNQRILSATYPESILNNIFKGKRIFGGLNVRQTRNGFTQNIIETNKYNINYSVLNKQIIFRDTINDIVIKVKRLK